MKYPKQKKVLNRGAEATLQGLGFGGQGHPTNIMYSDGTSMGGYSNVTLTSNNNASNSYSLTAANNLQ